MKWLTMRSWRLWPIFPSHWNTDFQHLSTIGGTTLPLKAWKHKFYQCNFEVKSLKASDIVKLYVPGDTRLTTATIIAVPPVSNSDFFQSDSFWKRSFHCLESNFFHSKAVFIGYFNVNRVGACIRDSFEINIIRISFWRWLNYFVSTGIFNSIVFKYCHSIIYVLLATH
jgi:hypothetical protein